VIVVVLSVTPERLRGDLTRWLLEISTGVYVGHLSARVRDHLWERITADVSSGRALMVWSARNEQRMQFKVHNHAWAVEDFDGIALMRRETSESREIAALRKKRVVKGESKRIGNRQSSRSEVEPETETETAQKLKHWSNAGRRRNYRNAIEQRHIPRLDIE